MQGGYDEPLGFGEADHEARHLAVLPGRGTWSPSISRRGEGQAVPEARDDSVAAGSRDLSGRRATADEEVDDEGQRDEQHHQRPQNARVPGNLIAEARGDIAAEVEALVPGAARADPLLEDEGARGR